MEPLPAGRLGARNRGAPWIGLTASLALAAALLAAPMIAIAVHVDATTRPEELATARIAGAACAGRWAHSHPLVIDRDGSSARVTCGGDDRVVRGRLEIAPP